MYVPVCCHCPQALLALDRGPMFQHTCCVFRLACHVISAEMYSGTSRIIGVKVSNRTGHLVMVKTFSSIYEAVRYISKRTCSIDRGFTTQPKQWVLPLLNLDFVRLITQPDPEHRCKQSPKPLNNIRSQIDESIEGLSISLVPLARIGLDLPSE